VHSDAATAADTDWHQIVALYDQLMAMAPTPVTAMNRAIALAERDGPAPALLALEKLTGLDGYHLFHAARGDLLERLGRNAEAVEAFDAAIERTSNAAELDLLRQRRAAAVQSPPC
jgi:RNA polymerase sigma-70 factor, ECF subfamily